MGFGLGNQTKKTISVNNPYKFGYVMVRLSYALNYLNLADIVII